MNKEIVKSTILLTTLCFALSQGVFAAENKELVRMDLDQILGQKIVIATDKAQTTRKRIKGILTTDKGQIVFVDTPGVHKPLNKLGEFLLDEAKIAVPDSDGRCF